MEGILELKFQSRVLLDNMSRVNTCSCARPREKRATVSTIGVIYLHLEIVDACMFIELYLLVVRYVSDDSAALADPDIVAILD